MTSINVPQIFLSLSGKDDAFVAKVWKHLPEGLALFYRKSFKNGEELLSAMEAAMQPPSLFFLLRKIPLNLTGSNSKLTTPGLRKSKDQISEFLRFQYAAGTTAMLPAWMRPWPVSRRC